MVACTGVTELLVYKRINNTVNYEKIQTISDGSVSGGRSCDITSDHKYLVSNDDSKTFIF